MIGLGSFFEKWRSRELDEIAFQNAVASSLKEVLGYDLDPSLFLYSSGTVFLKISPAAKSAVFLKKNEVLKKICEKTKRKVVDIR